MAYADGSDNAMAMPLPELLLETTTALKRRINICTRPATLSQEPGVSDLDLALLLLGPLLRILRGLGGSTQGLAWSRGFGRCAMCAWLAAFARFASLLVLGTKSCRTGARPPDSLSRKPA